MTLPATVRVNVNALFPSQVNASGSITLVKANGVYTIGQNLGLLGIIGSVSSPNTTYLQVYDALLGTTSRVAASGLAGIVGGFRERLTADRTYYFRTDGSDTNSGLANNAGAAFATIQKALDTVTDTLDLAGHTVTIQAGNNGTYVQTATMSRRAVDGSVVLQGDTVTPANMVISVGAGLYGIVASNKAELAVKGFQFTGATAAGAIRAIYSGRLTFESCDFGTFTAGSHVLADFGGECVATANYKVSGGAIFHTHSNYFGRYSAAAITITLVGPPAFSSGFVGNRESSTVFQGTVFSGTATGPRYVVHKNGTIDTLDAGLTYLPGNAVGTFVSGGVYETRQGADFYAQAGSFIANTAHQYFDAVNGHVLTGGVGSGNDFSFFSAAGFELFGNPTGTASINLSSGGVGSIGLNTAAVSTSWVKYRASTTAKSLMQLTVGVAPTTPVDGDAWLESNADTGVKVRLNGATRSAALLNSSGALLVQPFTVATIPAGSAAGQTVYASNCRVFNGAGVQEGAAAGTGGLVNYNGTAWKIAGTNITAVA